MKRECMKPAMMVAKLQHSGIICASDVRNVNSNADIDYGGGGSGPARARSHSGTDWDDEW